MPVRRIGEATAAIAVVCVGFTIAFWIAPEQPVLYPLVKFANSPHLIYSGSYWALVTSILLHGDLFHLIFNMYWLWKFGTLFEEVYGSTRLVVFAIIAGFVSNSLQLSFSGPCIGISGVVTALFGFIWQQRPYCEEFRMGLSETTIKFLMFMLIIMVPLSLIPNGLNIANIAHFAGLGFGMMVAWALTPDNEKHKRILGYVSVAVLFALSIATIAYSPWSVFWRWYQATEDAKNLYTTQIRVSRNNQPRLARISGAQLRQRPPTPDNWALLVQMYHENGKPIRALAVLKELKRYGIEAPQSLIDDVKRSGKPKEYHDIAPPGTPGPGEQPDGRTDSL